jgi:hypothetical protein
LRLVLSSGGHTESDARLRLVLSSFIHSYRRQSR